MTADATSDVHVHGSTGAPPVPFVTLDREHAAIRDDLRAAFNRILRRGVFVLGEEVEQFEAEWAATCGTAHCIGVASGTAALTALLRATGIGRGDEVIVPAHTYVATALSVIDAGATPVLCDVDDRTGLMDAAAAEAAVGPRTAAVVPVHLYGQLCDMRAIASLAARHGLALVEDAAQAHGARYEGRSAGRFGAGAAFSFYPSKNLGALGDAGAVCTDDDAIAERVRRLRNLGQRRKGEHVTFGVNERLDAVQAALLRIKLRHLEAGNAARRDHAARYRRLLGGRVRLLEETPSTPCVYHLFPVRVEDRDEVAARLADAGVQAAVHYTPALHAQPPLRDRAISSSDLVNATAWAAEELSLPMGPLLAPDEVDRSAAELLAALGTPTVTDGGTEHRTTEGGDRGFASIG